MLKQEKEHGHKPDPIEAYELVHKRKDEQRSWVDDASEQMGVSLIYLSQTLLIFSTLFFIYILLCVHHFRILTRSKDEPVQKTC